MSYEPFDGPFHGKVCNDERRCNIQHLSTHTAPGVKDGCVSGASQRLLLVRGQGIRCYALLRLGSYMMTVSLAKWFCMSEEKHRYMQLKSNEGETADVE